MFIYEQLYENMEDAKLTENKLSPMLQMLTLENNGMVGNSFELAENESGNECSDYSPLPPPKPYFDRDARQNKPFVQPITLARARSSSPLRNRAKDFWNSRNMSNSLPTLLSSRSIHNRSLGQLLNADNAGYEGSEVKPTRCSRIEEFDALLESL